MKKDNRPDLCSAWDEMYMDYLSSEVDCDALEKLLWDTYQFIFDNPGQKTIPDYAFTVQMAMILGINTYSNAGVIRDEVYCVFIEALLNHIFADSNRDELGLEIAHGIVDYIKPQTYAEFQSMIREVAEKVYSLYDDPDYCIHYETDCPKVNPDGSLDSCDGCFKYWEQSE